MIRRKIKLTSPPLPVTYILLILLSAVISLSLSNCATVDNTGDRLLHNAKELAIDATDAYIQVMTYSGEMYKLQGQVCTQQASIKRTDSLDLPAAIDQQKLYECMRPWNDARDEITDIANRYREGARTILKASSWMDIVLQIDLMRTIADELQEIMTNIGWNGAKAHEVLVKPLDAMEKGSVR